jgi:2-keto-3-deoxy-L-rhamnonate aldolase RhmA
MSGLRQRLKSGERLAGTFLKTPTGHAAEIFGDLGYDFVVIDAEHAPFDRGTTDIALMAARGAGVPALVRLASAGDILSVLDCGATGVLVPHVMDADHARDIAAACRYRGGSRGFSSGTRAGRYGGLSRWDLVDGADATTVVVAQIEDPDALPHVEAIAAVEGIDALFIGRGDLTVAMGASGNEAPEIQAAAARIAKAAMAAGKQVAVFASTRDEVRQLAGIGATMVVYSSDQGLMRGAAKKALADLREV